MNEEIHASGFPQYSEYGDATKEAGLNEWKAQQVEHGGGEMIQSLGRESEVLEENDPELRVYHERVNELREELKMVNGNDPTQSERYVELCRELAEKQANYKGDWTLLELRRVLDQKTHKKYIDVIDNTEGFKEGVPGIFDKEREFKATYESLRDDDAYTKHVADVFLYTNVTHALEQGRSPNNFGVGGYGKPGTVFTDAAMKESVTDGQGEEVEMVALNERQKNIIEAHEKNHGLFSFNDSPMGTMLREVFDGDVINELQKTRRLTYIREPDEILARMAQLRNYFGMDADDEFTLEHLAYAKDEKRYVQDVGLDNNMSDFLACISDKTQDTFIQAMNKFPM